MALQHNHILLHLVNDVPLLQLLLSDIRLAQEATTAAEAASAQEVRQRCLLREGISGRQDPKRTGCRWGRSPTSRRQADEREQ